MTRPDQDEPGRAARFPLGATVSVAALEDDPYPIFEALRAREPVSWAPALGMWYATRHAEVRAILLDAQRFTTGWETSTIFDTFGRQMLTTEGAEHDRYRMAAVEAFMPRNIRERLEPAMEQAAAGLVAGFKDDNEADLRATFASRLPVQTILLTFGMSLSGEGLMRRWYDSFERALANFEGDEAIRRRAHADVAEFHAYLDEAMREARRGGGSYGLLGTLVNGPPGERLSDEEIRRNMSIIFFGGISTVEALLLNSLWALFSQPGLLSRVRADLGLLPRVIDETMRWLSPVQSATRHVVEDVEVAGVTLRRGEVINCMLGAANRDPAVFKAPDRFDIDRRELSQHLGFAVGPHMCLGFRLAKAQARVGLTHLLTTLPGLRLDPGRSEAPSGYEFRQPRRLTATWRP
jgi:cytochrome P450